MKVRWFELYGQDVAVDEKDREWVMIAEAEFCGRSIARVRTYIPGRGLLVAKIVDCELTNEVWCTQADVAQIEREGEEGILAAARMDRRLARSFKEVFRSRQRRLRPHRVRS